MRRYWWTVWIKVAVVAVALFLGYRYIDNKIDALVSPYVLEEEDPSGSAASTVPETSEKPEPSGRPEKPGSPDHHGRPGITDPSEEFDENDKKDILSDMLGKVQDVLGVKLDLENMLFDYANQYAQQMKQESDEERHPGAVASDRTKDRGGIGASESESANAVP